MQPSQSNPHEKQRSHEMAKEEEEEREKEGENGEEEGEDGEGAVESDLELDLIVMPEH